MHRLKSRTKFPAMVFSPRPLKFLLLMVVSLSGTFVFPEGVLAQKQHGPLESKVKILRTAINQIRDSRFEPDRKIKQKESTLRKMAASRGISVDSVRRILQSEKFQPDPVDPDAFAIVRVDNRVDPSGRENGREPPNAAARALAAAMDKPFTTQDSVLDCTGQGEHRECDLRGGPESYFEIRSLEVRGDSARVSITWGQRPDGRHHFTIWLRRENGLKKAEDRTWTVQSSREWFFDTSCKFCP